MVRAVIPAVAIVTSRKTMPRLSRTLKSCSISMPTKTAPMAQAGMPKKKRA